MSEKIYKNLASHGIRIFCINIGREREFFIHDNKSVEEWRADLTSFVESMEATDVEGYANDHIFNNLYAHLRNLGYSQVEDVVADVFEGRISNEKAKLVADSEDFLESGFGHYGWENGNSNNDTHTNMNSQVS